MRVSIVIPTLGRRLDELRACLTAVERQTTRPLETLVVSPHGDREMEAVVAAFADSCGARVAVGSEAGLPAQRNRGIDQLAPSSDAVLFLDDDVVIAPSYLERLADVLEREPGVAGVAGVSMIEDQVHDPVWLRTWRRVFLGPTSTRPVLTRGGINRPASAKAGTEPLRADWLFGCALYSREVVDKTRFAEALGGYALMEDVEFSLRARSLGQLLVVSEARLEHRQSPTGRIEARDFGYQFARNRYWVLRSHAWSARTAVAFWWTTLGFAAIWGAAAVRGDAASAARLRGLTLGILAVLRRDLPTERDERAQSGEITVIVATIEGRKAYLERCLHGLQAQTVAPARVLVVRGRPTVLSAVRDGLNEATTDWVAFLDDDAIPQSDWLETLSRHFADPDLGAVGGRILDFPGGRTSARNYSGGPVARVTWYGRTLSRLHDIPLTRIVEDVDFLPGANMCFRRAALPQVDDGLDQGMAPGFEMALCLVVRRGGWRVVFDSDALVTHYPARRPAHLSREDRNRASYEYSYMVTYTLLKNLAWPRKLAFLAYFLLIGQRASPGLAFAPYFLLPGRSRKRFWAAWSGKLGGLRAAVT